MTIDFHVVIDTFPSVSEPQLEEWKRIADQFGIASALVSSGKGEVDLAEFNPTLEHAVGPGLPTVVPCFTWKPGAPHQAVQAILDVEPNVGVAIRCRPMGDWGASALETWAVGDMPAILADVRRPLIMEVQGSTPLAWNSVFALCVAYPDLPVVLSIAGRDVDTVSCLAAACPNVLIETSGLESEELKVFATDLGPDRLIFGSGYPGSTHERMLGQLSAAGISLAMMETVLDMNARRVLVGDWRPGASS